MDSLGGQPFAPTHRRRLQQSACRCPINPEYRAVTENEMIRAFNTTLDFSNDNLPTLSVQDVIEIENVPCDPNVQKFQTSIDLEFQSDSQDGVMTDEIANALAGNFIRSYNSLTERFCDPLFRRVETVEVTNKTATPVRRDRALQTSDRHLRVSQFTFVFSFRFYFIGKCRGCPRGASLFGVSIHC